MKVTAAKGTRCPREDNPRKYITDDVPEEVPLTAYYRRLLRDGSLVECRESPRRMSQPEKEKTGKEAKK